MKQPFYILLFMLSSTSCWSQTPEKAPIYRYFWDCTPMVGISDYLGKAEKTVYPDGSVSITNPSSYVGGIQFKMGNNFYLQKGKFNGVIRLTWFRVGVFLGEGAGLIATPLNLSLGHQFQLNQNWSVTPMITGGPVVIMDDPLYPSWTTTLNIMPELRLNYKQFSLGFEYTFRRFYTSYSNELNGYEHYIGLSIGKVFGEIEPSSQVKTN